LGLGSDRVLQFQVVTPDGQLRIANACQNTDLFWALRGGGGGTYGVILETTFKTEPQVTLQVLFVQFNATPALTRAFYDILINNSIQWSDEAWGGYLFPDGMQYLNPKLSLEAAQASMKNVTDWFASLPPGTLTTSKEIVTLSSYYEFEKTYAEPVLAVGPGLAQANAGRMIQERNFDTPEARSQLLDAMMEFITKQNGNTFIEVAGPRLYSSSVPNITQSSAAHPAWRTTIWWVIALDIGWPWDITLAEIEANYEALTTSVDILRKITPTTTKVEGGSYINEADTYEPSWQTAFFGSHYEQLLSIKHKYDPKGLLDCWRCVGWNGPSSDRYGCYPTLS